MKHHCLLWITRPGLFSMLFDVNSNWLTGLLVCRPFKQVPSHFSRTDDLLVILLWCSGVSEPLETATLPQPCTASKAQTFHQVHQNISASASSTHTPKPQQDWRAMAEFTNSATEPTRWLWPSQPISQPNLLYKIVVWLRYRIQMHAASSSSEPNPMQNWAT